jgi:hypothetical protein
MEIAQFLFLMNNNNKDYLIKIDEDSSQELNLNWFNNSQKFVYPLLSFRNKKLGKDLSNQNYRAAINFIQTL